MRLRRGPDRNPADRTAASNADVAADLRHLRRRVAIELSAELDEAEIARVAETAHTILGMTLNERAALGLVLADAQGDMSIDNVLPPKELWPDETRA